MTEFKDHFSALATDYASFRPRYPARLFADLAAVAPGPADGPGDRIGPYRLEDAWELMLTAEGYYRKSIAANPAFQSPHVNLSVLETRMGKIAKMRTGRYDVGGWKRRAPSFSMA